jgi:hypothetical protein
MKLFSLALHAPWAWWPGAAASTSEKDAGSRGGSEKVMRSSSSGRLELQKEVHGGAGGVLGRPPNRPDLSRGGARPSRRAPENPSGGDGRGRCKSWKPGHRNPSQEVDDEAEKDKYLGQGLQGGCGPARTSEGRQRKN